ncbi:hypothetical protein [Candidatus Contubernalis alkaliaceticus]|uniref:hypothetical protein n=1 Tax=Candidatus Contubernalis alkaliaceticus TaxID=338645 RepID=UPI001F4C3B9E|nr:hypothetical protein [Candidatus Contubernalis alkalaceticus]UNC91959.1 hypothetical protein HUE98_07515 [Candidatus Contubernalis alkalaceticus]
MKLYGCNRYLCDNCGAGNNTRTYALGSKGTACNCERIITLCDRCRERLLELLEDETKISDIRLNS